MAEDTKQSEGDAPVIGAPAAALTRVTPVLTRTVGKESQGEIWPARSMLGEQQFWVSDVKDKFFTVRRDTALRTTSRESEVASEFPVAVASMASEASQPWSFASGKAPSLQEQPGELTRETSHK